MKISVETSAAIASTDSQQPKAAGLSGAPAHAPLQMIGNASNVEPISLDPKLSAPEKAST